MKSSPQNSRSKTLHEERTQNGSTFEDSQQFPQYILESLEDYALFTTDVENRVLSWNVGAEKIFRYTAEEIIGQDAAILFIPEDRQKKEPQKELEIAIKKGRARDEKWHLRKDGTRFWASGLVFPLKDDAGVMRGFTKIARDLTKQKEFETERKKLLTDLEAEKKKLADIFERAPAFMATIRGEKHVFEMANAAYYQLVGHRDIIGKSIQEALPEIAEQGFITILDRVFETGQPFVGNEVSILLEREKDAPPEQRYVNFVYQPTQDPSGKITGIVAHGYDVSEQVLARERIAESELRYRTLFNTIDEGFCVIEVLFDEQDKPNDYRFLETNPVFEKQTGIIHPVGKTVKELIPSIEEHWIETYGKVAKTGLSIRFTEGSDAMGKWFDVYASRVDGPKSNKVALLFTDITKRIQLERQKDEFIGIASHELKTPVTSVKAYGQILVKTFRQQGDERAAELLSKMDAQITRLSSLIEDLLDVTKIRAGRLQFNERIFDFNELVRDTVEELQRTSESHTIETKLKRTRQVFGDRERIGQVITNFITNATKYSPQTSTIIVHTKIDTQNITLGVTDFGVGIPKNKQKHIFEQFYRVSGDKQHTFPGLGLGLYISSEIIRRENGKIWFDSEKGKGSTFYFSIPIYKEPHSSS